METVVLHLSRQSYKDLQEQAHRAGKPVEVFTRDILEDALQQTGTQSPAKTTREILEAGGRLRPLGEHLKRRIIPGVTLEEVRETLKRSGGPSLSELILEQRGPRG